MKRYDLKKVSFAVLLICAFLNAQPLAAQESSQQSGKGDLSILPFVYYTPETRTAFVLSGIYTKSGSTQEIRPTSLKLFLTYTSQNQRMIEFFPEVYTPAGIRISGEAIAMDFPDKFYGIGPDAIEDDEEDYTRLGVRLDAAVQYEIYKDIFAGLRLNYEDLEVEDVETGGLIDSGTVPGDGGGIVSGAGLLVHYDGRDDIFMPSKGLYLETSAMSYGRGMGGDFDYSTFVMDLRQFVSPGSWTLAFQEYFHFSGGDPPFHRLAQLGGSGLMRGFFKGRFRDQNMAVFQVESRIPLSRKFGLVLFGSTGGVAPDPDELELDSFLTAGGAGLRYRIGEEEAIKLRIDLAWGEGGNSGAYFTINEAF
jgi:hypothetical protein